eukprot:365608-Chlamydomonas_euryale.AAC.12
MATVGLQSSPCGAVALCDGAASAALVAAPLCAASRSASRAAALAQFCNTTYASWSSNGARDGTPPGLQPRRAMYSESACDGACNSGNGSGGSGGRTAAVRGTSAHSQHPEEARCVMPAKAVSCKGGLSAHAAP